MTNTYQLHISYPAHVSLYRLTSTVESIKGVKIQRLKLVKKGKRMIGKMAIEVSPLSNFDCILDLIQREPEFSVVEDLLNTPYDVVRNH
ncbi:hypothetical protein GCM10027275_54910 [Rhabdobacter roseus]|uniref:Uncharacterized protein n=1 Tax=Rhabdobacter roseus TaxID=1655419 RepID=A0A840TSY8_9BACT|nr:hypothetical protein [Rhabdobacter roseus]